MEIAEVKKRGFVVLSPKGRLDASTAPLLEEKLLALIGGGEKKVAIDFLLLDYISSAGLRVLLLAAKQLKPVDGKIILYALKDHIKEVFEIAGFLTVFSVFDREDQALQSLE